MLPTGNSSSTGMQRRDDHDGYDHPEEPHPRSREGTTPVIPLVRMAAAIDDDPTLEQIDELLTELLLPGLHPERLPNLQSSLLSCRCSHADELLEPRLDVALAVVGLVSDALYEIVDVDSGVEVRRADLGELVKDPVTDLPPVRPQHLLDLLRLLLVHAITSLQPAWATGKILPEPRVRHPQ